MQVLTKEQKRELLQSIQEVLPTAKWAPEESWPPEEAKGKRIRGEEPVYAIPFDGGVELVLFLKIPLGEKLSSNIHVRLDKVVREWTEDNLVLKDHGKIEVDIRLFRVETRGRKPNPDKEGTKEKILS